MKDGACIMGDNGKMMELGGPVTVTTPADERIVYDEANGTMTMEMVLETLKGSSKISEAKA